MQLSYAQSPEQIYLEALKKASDLLYDTMIPVSDNIKRFANETGEGYRRLAEQKEEIIVYLRSLVEGEEDAVACLAVAEGKVAQAVTDIGG